MQVCLPPFSPRPKSSAAAETCAIPFPRVRWAARGAMAEQDMSALVILVPEVELIVGAFRTRFDTSAIAGLGAHITILAPLIPPASLSQTDVSDLRTLFADHPAFEFSLVGLCGFPSALYLAPDPLTSFDALTEATAARFPQHPPYGGAFASPVPHLTVALQPPAEDLEAVAGSVLTATALHLPIACSAHEVELVFRRNDRWSVQERFALA